MDLGDLKRIFVMLQSSDGGSGCCRNGKTLDKARAAPANLGQPNRADTAFGRHEFAGTALAVSWGPGRVDCLLGRGILFSPAAGRHGQGWGQNTCAWQVSTGLEGVSGCSP